MTFSQLFPRAAFPLSQYAHYLILTRLAPLAQTFVSTHSLAALSWFDGTVLCYLSRPVIISSVEYVPYKESYKESQNPRNHRKYDCRHFVAVQLSRTIYGNKQQNVN